VLLPVSESDEDDLLGALEKFLDLRAAARLRPVAVLVLSCLLLAQPAAADDPLARDVFGAVSHPEAGPPQVIGTYAEG